MCELCFTLEKENAALRARLKLYEPLPEIEFGRPSMVEVAKLVAAKHELTLKQLREKSALRRFSWPRQEAMWHMRCHRKSFPQIAKFFGLDHTTVIAGIASFQRRAGEEK